MAPQQCRVLLPGVGEVFIPLPVSSLDALRAAVKGHFNVLDGQDYAITDTVKAFDSDSDVQTLRDGATLVLTSAANHALAAPATERISFQPHPKTLTMAGEFEYFAAQGRHPFVYALAEFIDNSLRATRRNAPRPRSITVSLVVSGSNPATAQGLIAIQDNGCGMNKHELADWAVMNLSMEERGAAPQEPAAAGRGVSGATGAGRFLTGDLSFFGVGSKNAGFFMGSSIKVATKRQDELYVHELRLAAADLEQRYQNREEVYAEDMVHRNPADASTLSTTEHPFSVAHAWVAAEGEDVDEGGAGPTFTRVVIGDLKPDVLRQIMDDEQGTYICQELGHLYHYYIWGEQGNRASGGAAAREGRLPNGEPFPDIVLRYQVDSRVVWQQRLADVDDDMESKLLRAQRAELPFTLQVPDKGTVGGVLWYFPYLNDQETVPEENPHAGSRLHNSPVQQFGGRPTQLGATQHPGGQTQAQRGMQLHGGGGGGDDEEDEEAQAWQTAPIFEAFWQGRLIPGARIDTLPFLEAVRTKRSAQAKDVIPDEAFRRLRGALFFGPTFRVTRNKLLFRDNLGEVLAAAVPGERQMEAKLRQWLQRCHTTLDKSVRFEALADSHTQSAMRSKLGEDTTAFERITDGARTVCKGDVVRVNAKPQLVGHVVCFTIPQAVRAEGSYSNGRLHIELLPTAVYGPATEKQFSLRRLDAVLSEAEQEEHMQKELLRVATTLRVEPMRFATGQALEFAVGDTIPETAASVLSGGGQRMSRVAFTKERVVVTQRLWRLPAAAAADGQAAAGAAGAVDAAEEEGGGRAAKRQRKGRKGKGRQDENRDPAPGAAAACVEGSNGVPAGAELVLCMENKTPIKDVFQFARISDGLQRSGWYALEFVAAPAAPGQPPLSLVVQLVVAPGPPCTFSLSGEGKAVAALKDIALGEVLPPLKVTFSDSFGNPAALQSSQASPSLKIVALVPNIQGELQPCEELQVVAQQTATDDGLLVTGLQLLGSAAAAAVDGEAAGLQLLAGCDGLSHPTGRQAQVQPSRQALPIADVQLSIGLDSLPELEAVLLPLRVRAGAPQSLRLLPGHPWEAAPAGDGNSAAAVVTLGSGGSLEAFQVAAFDAWGNPTAPSPDLGFTVLAQCDATAPQAAEFTPSAGGIVTVEGLVGATATSASGPASLGLSIKAHPASAGTEAAVAAAEPSTALAVLLAVEASVLPTSIQLYRQAQLLPTKVVEGEDGCTTVALLEGVPADSSVHGLHILLLDASGAPSTQQLAGKITLSWRGGSKTTAWSGHALKLPPYKAPKSASEACNEWVRFTSADPPLTLELPVEIRAAPAEPAAWTVSLVDQLTSQHCEELGVVQCGQPFAMEIEAIDAFNNRCAGGGSSLPMPLLSIESEGPLQYNEQEWEQGWVVQGGEQVYSVRMTVAGHPGAIKITVRDAGGEGGAPLLTEDSLSVELRAGPAAQLAVEGAGTLECGTRAAIPQLRVRVCDAAGNHTSDQNFEVSLSSSALAIDGSGRAASVTASGGNKVKMKRGVAVFRDVRVVAEEAGSYELRVQGASRKIAVEDAVLHCIMQPLNVTALGVLLPEVLEGGQCLAGTTAELHVEVRMESGLPLPPEAAIGSLTLKVTPPGGGKSDAVVYSLPAPEPGEEGPQTEEGHYAFQLHELTCAGEYSAVAEYVEQRPQLAAGLSKKDAAMRSASVRFNVQPGQPIATRLEAAAVPDQLTVTNGDSSKQRLMLRNAAVQLLDAYDNAAGGGGVQVRCRLRLPPGAAADGSSQLPELDCGQGCGPQETDDGGRVFLGDLSVVQGSGKATSGTLQCELVCEALGLYPSSAHELEMDGDGWAVCWSCPVLFSDDAARFAHIERVNQQRGELAQRRDELNQRMGDAQRGLADAQAQQQQVHQQMADKEKDLPGPAPTSVKSALKQLAAARQQVDVAAVAEPEEAVEARYGNPKNPLTSSIDRVLQSGDAGLLGVVAQLATVDDVDLSRVLAVATRGQLTTVVVQDVQARQRIAAMLAAAKYPVPDMLPTTMMFPSMHGVKSGDSPGFSNAGHRAHVLQLAACRGTDPPLALPLPHTVCINKMRERADGIGMSASDWPRGCLGFAINLVRPVHQGHRATILASQLNNVLVFETLKDAEQYKEFTSQKLRTATGTFLTLDGGRILSSGVVSGASFQVPPLDKLDVRFGSSCSLGQNAAAAQALENVALLEEWVQLLRSRDEAAQVEAQAQAERAEAECQEELEGVEAQIQELEAQLALGEMGSAVAAVETQQKQRKRQQLEEENAGEVDRHGEGQGSGGKRKRRRRQP